MTTIISTSELGYKINNTSILSHLSLALAKGEAMAITGISGSGKTTLGQLLAGNIEPTSGELTYIGTKRVMINQQDNFVTATGKKSAYYGQRYENTWMDNSPFINEYIDTVAQKNGIELSSEQLDEVLLLLNLKHLETRRILQLSNGERKRTQLAAAIIQKPDLLVLDQPYVGLDVESRQHLAEVFQTLIDSQMSLAIICDPNEITPAVTSVIELDKGEIKQMVKREEYKPKFAFDALINELDKGLLKGYHTENMAFDYAVQMKDVNVTLNGSPILKAINWEVKRGDQWALVGHNGAGKTTLLSLITADNPQGYTNDLKLFDKQRGSGESVWDIKKRIGYLSPELHLYFLRGEGIYNSIPGLAAKPHSNYCSLTCLDVILSGINDEIGFVSNCSDLQIKTAKAWLGFIGLQHLEKRSFTSTSMGEQRSLLLARALVKSPDLIILDEPCQGMDRYQTMHFTHLLELICKEINTTLIYVTHYSEELPRTISKTIKLEKGVRVE